jgi:NAD+ kinase
LRWNEREKQKSFVVVEEDNEPAVKRQSDRQRAEDNMADQADQSNNGAKEQEGEESDDEDEEEEEEDYDIDE